MKTHAFDSYGAACENSAVCEGYAEAFKLLCDIVPMSLEKEPESLRALHREVLRFSKGVSSKGDYYDVLIAHAEALAEVRKISEFKIFTDTELLREVGLM